MKRRIAVVTGTRAEYGLLTSTLHAIAAHPRLELRVIVTGIHLLPRFGRTVREIARDGWPIAARVPMQRGDDDPLDQAVGLGRGVIGITRALERCGADVVLVLGDRIEALAGALAGVTTGRVVAQVHAGDVAQGDFDDSLRHAITKLAHLHLAATREAARRVVRMGEDPRHVHVVGAPGLDRLRELLTERTRRRGPSRSDAAPYALVVYHAWGRAAVVEQRTMSAVLDAARAAGLRRVILYPNTDRGHTGVLRAIARHVRTARPGEVEVARSLPRDEYLRRLLEARVLIGNSSSGIIEAPLAGVPVVDVGGRQAGRTPGGPAVLHCGETPGAIRAALRRALALRLRRGGRNMYGDGHTGARIARRLAAAKLPDARKRIAY